MFNIMYILFLRISKMFFLAFLSLSILFSVFYIMFYSMYISVFACSLIVIVMIVCCLRGE